MLGIFKKGNKVSPPLTALPSFLCNATVLAYYDSYDEVMDLLMDLCKNTRSYWRSTEHRTILAALLRFKPCERIETEFVGLAPPKSSLNKEQKDYQAEIQRHGKRFAWPEEQEFAVKCLVEGKKDPLVPLGFKMEMGWWLEDIVMVCADRTQSRAFGMAPKEEDTVARETIAGPCKNRIAKVSYKIEFNSEKQHWQYNGLILEDEKGNKMLEAVSKKSEGGKWV